MVERKKEREREKGGERSETGLFCQSIGVDRRGIAKSTNQKQFGAGQMRIPSYERKGQVKEREEKMEKKKPGRKAGSAKRLISFVWVELGR